MSSSSALWLKGRTAPKYHALTRPTKAEAEGVHRAIAIAEMADSPVYIVHLSCYDALEGSSGSARCRACLHSPRPVRNICFSITATTRAKVLKERSMS